jgi:hypothetical protein
MTSIPMIDLLTIIFVLVDDWYQAKGVKLLQGKPGVRPEFTDSDPFADQRGFTKAGGGRNEGQLISR